MQEQLQRGVVKVAGRRIHRHRETALVAVTTSIRGRGVHGIDANREGAAAGWLTGNSGGAAAAARRGNEVHHGSVGAAGSYRNVGGAIQDDGRIGRRTDRDREAAIGAATAGVAGIGVHRRGANGERASAGRVRIDIGHRAAAGRRTGEVHDGAVGTRGRHRDVGGASQYDGRINHGHRKTAVGAVAAGVAGRGDHNVGAHRKGAPAGRIGRHDGRRAAAVCCGREVNHGAIGAGGGHRNIGGASQHNRGIRRCIDRHPGRGRCVGRVGEARCRTGERRRIQPVSGIGGQDLNGYHGNGAWNQRAEIPQGVRGVILTSRAGRQILHARGQKVCDGTGGDFARTHVRYRQLIRNHRADVRRGTAGALAEIQSGAPFGGPRRQSLAAD